MAFTVAIDGPAASGKGTISKRVAAHFGLGHLDTGLLYRAVGRRMLDGEEPVSAARALVPGDLEVEGLRTAAVGEAASRVGALPEVRAALLDFQRAFARRSGGAVLDGRDIGTVICPEAEAKLFVTASAEVRAERRFRELVAAGADTRFEAVLEDIRARDERDMGRSDAPLRPADDAVTIDTSRLDVEAAVAAAIAAVDAARDVRSAGGSSRG
ncbi:Cytidylate kinase [Roseivivax jejudonensis]|uniref:Cytidylate kinase n=1 Tax=Roseivivax jejudonensis TaxID=1529041 RepID=A0A1X6ZJ25_9RHOB|nr:d(CMP) kinase [Roseivivax jejudonensis]SLN52432.1 Cytidylate kinase [Roseivivax jejudonensis]